MRSPSNILSYTTTPDKCSTLMSSSPWRLLLFLQPPPRYTPKALGLNSNLSCNIQPREPLPIHNSSDISTGLSPVARSLDPSSVTSPVKVSCPAQHRRGISASQPPTATDITFPSLGRSWAPASKPSPNGPVTACRAQTSLLFFSPPNLATAFVAAYDVWKSKPLIITLRSTPVPAKFRGYVRGLNT